MDTPGKDSQRKLTASGMGIGYGDEFPAQARLIPALVCIAAVYLVPGGFGQDDYAIRTLFFAYLGYALFDLASVRFQWVTGWIGWLSLHTVEVVLICLIVLHTGGSQSPFLGLFLLALLAAASKWGFKGAIISSSGCVFLLLLGVSHPRLWLEHASEIRGDGNHLAAAAVSMNLVLAAGVLGFLLEREKKRFINALLVTQLLRRIAPEPSFRSALGHTLISVREYFDADQVRLAIQQIDGEQAVAWEVTRLAGSNENDVRSWRLTESLRHGSLAMPPEPVRRGLGLGAAAPKGKPATQVDVKLTRRIYRRFFSGFRQESSSQPADGGFGNLRVVSEQHSPLVSAWSMLATSFSLEGKWLGRLTVYSPRRGWNSRTGLRFLETLVREVGPAVYNKYLVARIRSLAQTRERGRLAQELHDGIIQSLIGLEMQIDVLRHNPAVSSDPGRLLEELNRLQMLLHNEIAGVREEMQRIKPLEVEPGRLLEYIAGMVDKFRREQSISASFIAKPQEITLPPRVCTELVRIVQEALANVRKHSGARKVLVRFNRENGRYRLCVEDDGRGFSPVEPLSSTEFEASSIYPLVVTERVRAIGGELVVESTRGSGVRLEILLPVTANGTDPGKN